MAILTRSKEKLTYGQMTVVIMSNGACLDSGIVIGDYKKDKRNELFGLDDVSVN